MNSRGPLRDRRKGLAWIVDLYTLLNTHRNVVAAGRCGVVNAFIGFLLIGLAILMGTGDVPGGSIQAVAIGGLGGFMVIGMVAVGVWPSAAFVLMTWQAGLFVVFAGIFTIDSLRWLFKPSPLKSFRYLPGMFLFPWAYGSRQIGAFGPWPRQARTIGRTGIWMGLVCEVVFVIGALLRISRRLH